MITDRLTCAVLTAAGGLLLVARLRDAVARAVWMLLLTASVAYAVILTAQPHNLININVVHYYLGAKYAIPYPAFYEVTYAALERPQTGMHDLAHPPAYVRREPAEQRAYYIDLLRSEGASFDPLTDVEALREQAVRTGAIKRQADAILSRYLPAPLIGDFREDVRRAFLVEGGETRSIGDDYGYNGSPFYSLVRHADPSLHRPFSRAIGIINLVWQIPAALLAIWLLGASIGLGTTQRLAAMTLAFASWDIVGWALPGLIFAGLWLPVGAACSAARRGYAIAAGIAIAWAGLIKLFPYALVLLPALLVVREAAHRASGKTTSGSWRWHMTLLLSCAVASALLVLMTLPSGRSWPEFLAKIAVQFQSPAYLQNSVSLNQLLMVLGVFDSPILPVLRILVAVTLGIVIWVAKPADAQKGIARRFMLLLALLGLLVDTWFNYYALAALVLIPWAAASSPKGTVLAVLSLAAAYLLPEFDNPVLQEHRALWFLKLLPYVTVPCWLAYIEFAPRRLRTQVKTALTVLLALCGTLIVGEAARAKAVRSYEHSGNVALDRARPQQALPYFEKLLRISPRNAIAEMNRGISLAMLGRDAEAVGSLARAVSLSPATVETRVNHAHLLLKLGRLDDALQQVEAALEISPCRVETWIERGRIMLALARQDEARGSLMRALELEPTNSVARDMLRSVPRNG